MAECRVAFQQPDPGGVDRRTVQGGDYRWYLPDRLADSMTVLDEQTAHLLGEVTAAAEQLGDSFATSPLPALYATLLRSESIASSRIEGVREDPARVLLAGLEDESVTSTPNAILINRNIDAVRNAVESLAATSPWQVEDIDRLQASLLPPAIHGLRRVPVWISGSSPLRAKYVAPMPEHVPELMQDLVSYLETTSDPVLMKAALSHAQLETIHPWVDGNGRAGRALIQAVLARSGLIRGGILPISVVLGQRDSGYIKALTAFRYDPRRGENGNDARLSFVRFFLEAARDAVTVAQDLLDQVHRVADSWSEKTQGVRSHSAQHRILELLADRPVLTVSYTRDHTEYTDASGARRQYSRAALGKAFTELERRGIVSRTTTRDKGQIVYTAREIVDLLVLSERRLGSTQLDTAASPLPKVARRRTPVLPEHLRPPTS